MGIHIYLVDHQGNKHPEWETGRHSGDATMVDFMFSDPHLVGYVSYDYKGVEYVEYEIYRPENITALRCRLLELKWNQPRWDQLCEILHDDRYWMHWTR